MKIKIHIKFYSCSGIQTVTVKHDFNIDNVGKADILLLSKTVTIFFIVLDLFIHIWFLPKTTKTSELFIEFFILSLPNLFESEFWNNVTLFALSSTSFDCNKSLTFYRAFMMSNLWPQVVT